ncbi:MULTISPECIES: flagellar basal body rod protein FlgB [Thiomicrorhabdus]|uniref:Flagellar basal body rod protein FlgB n=1 Tax=Thiomicrorhabdus heinhorstiae TaxID=2748010 RepID=A0ABS0C066_9GAMM|nr:MULTISPECIES: flagellar basal body rod protein FlgB [Thiomicrorhabdus]MBF6058685.1 flagellar basal body rod protein FlgB [Thiomicrorhabdus heinhorstiae]
MAESIFGIHEQALLIRNQRAQVLANNIANADTPNYKARDIDFRAALQEASSKNNNEGDLPLMKTNSAHLQTDGGLTTSQFLKYRQPLQPSLDGNTVEGHVEKAKFMENAIQQQATLQFLNGKISGISSALKGE